MSRQTWQLRSVSGRQRWLVITVALGIGTAVAVGLVLDSQAATARECHRETPLPADARLIAPGSEVPEAVARFAGAWSGAWLDNGKKALCHTLVVEEVYANGFARVIFSVGTSADLDLRQPNFWYTTGRIVDGELRFDIHGIKLAYRVADDALQGNSDHPDGITGRVSLARMADVSQVGCGSPSGGLPPAPPVTGPRDRLTAAELLMGTNPGSGPVHNAYFMPVGQAAPALHTFKGTVTVATSTMLRARHGCPGLSETLPGFAVTFFTHGEHLVPAVRDILDPPGIILSPGRVWSEPGDGGLSRASFPLVVSTSGVARHYGLVTFLYDDTRVSALRFQVAQEHDPFDKGYDGWGQASMTYTPGPIADEEVLRAQFAAELRQQTPIRPWSALPLATAGPWLKGFDGDSTAAEIKASGVIVDGVIYLRGCETRAGPYPYCRHLRHYVRSVSKSLGAAVTLLWLAQQYGDQVFDLKIKDYITVTASHDGWEPVTFGDALNMATGIGDNAPYQRPNEPLADEGGPKMRRFWRAQTAKERLDIAFAYGKYPWGPGEVFRYNNTHTFVLAAAMDSFLKHKVGPHAQLWDMVVAEVFRPIGIFHAPMLHTKEVGGARGIPLPEHGFYPTIDDVAKLTTLLQSGGQHQGRQLLSATKLAEALYQTDAIGLPSRRDNRFGEGRYHRSFWSVPYRTATGCVFQIPYMWGYGGNFVVLLPNGLSAFRFADGNHYDVDTMILAGEALRPFPCPAGSGEALPPERQALSASDLRAELPGHTLYDDHGRGHIFLASSGVQYARWPGAIDVGTWHITADGYFCNTWHMWRSRRERCFAVYREGETFELHGKDRLDKGAYRRVPGNPEGY